jgi:hypothetical protein
MAMFEMCNRLFVCSVRLAKMLIVAYKTGSLPISLVAAMVACVSERYCVIHY